MKTIDGEAKTVRQMLDGERYAIDYYQRAYRWETKQVGELLDDLTTRFLDDHDEAHDRSAVAGYGHYFLGSVILSNRAGKRYIVDGQQRLTTLTLLLIFLHNLQRGREARVDIGKLISSERYGRRAFNIEVDDRIGLMTALINDEPFDADGHEDAVQTILRRYEDIREKFPLELRDASLPYFIDWLIDNVHVVAITTQSDEDAYAIFETMNDRGLSLSPLDMLKGYLLASIAATDRADADAAWKSRVQHLARAGREADADCFKAWLRGRHAITIRDKGTLGAGDYDKIGSEFHRWVRDHDQSLGLTSPAGFLAFVRRDFEFYSRQFLRISQASQAHDAASPEIFYNAQSNFTLQPMLLLATVEPGEPMSAIDRKFRLVATAVDIWLFRRVWNFKSTAQRDVKFMAFDLAKRIRGLGVDALSTTLKEWLGDDDGFGRWDSFGLHGMNRKQVHRLLARITDHVEVSSGRPSRYVELTGGVGRQRFEIEHVWANRFDRHSDTFGSEAEFADQRNRIGGLLLLPKSFNASYGDDPYEYKLKHYPQHNLLAASLNSLAYENNPGFVNFIRSSGLAFNSHEAFAVNDAKARHALYQQVARRVWDVNRLQN